MISFSTKDAHAGVLLLIVGGITASITALAVSKMDLFKRDKKKLGHRMSFTSAAMAMGCFPERINLGDFIINIIITFDRKDTPTMEDILPLIQKLFKYDRLSGLPVGRAGSPDWYIQKIDSVVDPNRMIRVINTSCDTKEDLASVIQQQRDFSVRRRETPWWEFVLVKNDGKGDSLLIFRIDHSVGDGLSVAKAFNDILTRGDGSTLTNLVPESMHENRKRVDMKWFQMALKFIPSFFGIATLPISRVDDPTAFSKNICGPGVVDNHNRKIIIFDPIPINFIKALKNAASVSLNDILLTALSQAIHDYCRQKECAVLQKRGEKIQCRAAVVFGFPEQNMDKKTCIHNSWAPLSVDLGVGFDGILHRLTHVNSVCNKLKQGPNARIQLGFQNRILSHLPTGMYRKLVFDQYSRHSLTCTNVPGPQEKVFISGHPAKAAMFCIDHLHPLVSMFSYDGHIYITMSADDLSIPDVDLMIPPLFMNALGLLGQSLKVAVPEGISRVTKKRNCNGEEETELKEAENG